MKKLIIILFIAISFQSLSQNIIGDWAYLRQRLTLKDSVVTAITSGDTLATIEKVRSTISDSINSKNFLSLGTANQIPFVNALGTDLDYSVNFEWNGTTLNIGDNLGNISIGDNIHSSITGDGDIFIGNYIAPDITTGSENIFIGEETGTSITTGSSNIFIGYNAGLLNNGSGNIFIGTNSAGTETGSNKLYIDNSSIPNALIKGDFATDELWLNTDTTHIIGHLEVDSNLYVFGRSILEKYEAAAYVPIDSTLTTATTSTWQFLGIGDNNKFVNTYAEGFVLSGDTLVFQQQSNDLRDSIEFHLDWSTVSAASNNGVIIFYGIFIKSVGESVYSESKPHTMQNKLQTSGDFYNWGCSTYPIFLKDGDKIQIRIRSASTSTTVTTERFNIYLREQ